MDEQTSEIQNIPGRVRVNIWISSDAHKALEEISIRDNRSVSDLVREALRDFISKDRVMNNGSGKD